jgi:hypothetical protein
MILSENSSELEHIGYALIVTNGKLFSKSNIESEVKCFFIDIALPPYYDL